jgi:hypothetical protein
MDHEGFHNTNFNYESELIPTRAWIVKDFTIPKSNYESEPIPTTA